MNVLTLTVNEYDQLPIDDGGGFGTITSKEADVLVKLAQTRPGFCTFRGKSIAFSHYCGIVNLGSRMLEIVPKVGFEERQTLSGQGLLIRLLLDAGAIPSTRQSLAAHGVQRATLLQSFIAGFLDEVKMLVSGGLLRRYDVVDDDLQVVRGRIDIQRQMTQQFGRPDLLACRFDDLNSNNLLNRAVKTGLHKVGSWISDTNLERLNNQLINMLDDVDDIAVSLADLDRISLDRQAARYRSALDWVRWILRLLSPDLRGGDNEAPGLLFDMNRVFQDAVANRWSKNCVGVTRISLQDTSRHFVMSTGQNPKPSISLRPDIVFRRKESVVAIGDTKWKQLSLLSNRTIAPTAGDFYQMHAYASVYRCNQLFLIYPWHPGLSDCLDCSYVLPSFDRIHPEVHVICVDLHADGYPAIVGAAALLGLMDNNTPERRYVRAIGL